MVDNSKWQLVNFIDMTEENVEYEPRKEMMCSKINGWVTLILIVDGLNFHKPLQLQKWPKTQ